MMKGKPEYNPNAALVDHQSALVDLCRAIGGGGDGRGDALMLDTEFMRVNTYYPRLCLVQVAVGTTVACVDVLRCDSLAPLAELILDEGRLKVMHSCRQDLEILHLALGRAPAPVFDTQVAATAAGHGGQIGYAGLVHQLLQVKLEKTAQRTDWSRRPLSGAQVRYALDDVRYLAAMFARLRGELQKRGRLAWVEEDCAALADDALHDMNAADAWLRGARRLGAGLSAQKQQVLKHLAEWREEAARRADRPREWIVDNSALAAMARKPPRTLKELAALKALPPHTLRRRGDALVRAVVRGLRAAPVAVWKTEGPMSERQRKLFHRCRDFLAAHCEQHAVPAPLVATVDDLKRFVHGRRDLALLRGWRHDFAGRRMERMAYNARP